MRKTTRAPRQVAVSAVEGSRSEDLAAHIEGRLNDAALELETLKGEVASLGILASSRASADHVPDPKLLTVRQAAVTLGVGESTVHQLIREGRLGSVKIATARRIPTVAIDAFISELSEHEIGA